MFSDVLRYIFVSELLDWRAAAGSVCVHNHRLLVTFSTFSFSVPCKELNRTGYLFNETKTNAICAFFPPKQNWKIYIRCDPIINPVNPPTHRKFHIVAKTKCGYII